MIHMQMISGAKDWEESYLQYIKLKLTMTLFTMLNIIQNNRTLKRAIN